MPLKIVLLRPQNWSRLKPYYSSIITAVKVFLALEIAISGALAAKVLNTLGDRHPCPIAFRSRCSDYKTFG